MNTFYDIALLLHLHHQESYAQQRHETARDVGGMFYLMEIIVIVILLQLAQELQSTTSLLDENT